MKHLYAGGIAIWLLNGCATTLAPHSAYIPLLRKQGEAEARLCSNLGGRKLELQVGYQATNRLVLHTALLSYKLPQLGTNFRSLEAGLGYYVPLADERWRLGGHVGAAYGNGRSGTGTGCFECAGPRVPFSQDYFMRYTSIYVQPTLLRDGHTSTWGVALRLGRAAYHRFDEVRLDSAGATPQLINRAGHVAVFVQPTVEFSQQLLPWLSLSGSVGMFSFIRPDVSLDLTSPLLVRAGLHFVVSRRPGSEP